MLLLRGVPPDEAELGGGTKERAGGLPRGPNPGCTRGIRLWLETFSPEGPLVTDSSCLDPAGFCNSRIVDLNKKCLYFQEPLAQRIVILDVLKLCRPVITLLLSCVIGRVVRSREMCVALSLQPPGARGLGAYSLAWPAPLSCIPGTWLPPQRDGLAGLRGVAHAVLVYRSHSEDVRLPFLQIQKGESWGFHRSF